VTETATPGSTAPASLERVHQEMAERRAHRPVHLSPGHLDGPDGWLVTRYRDVRQIMSDPRIRRDMTTQPGREPETEPNLLERHLLYLDPPDHPRVRRLVSRAFTPRAVERLRPGLESLVSDLLDQLAAAGEADLVRDFALPVPVFAICQVLGVPDDERADFWAWSHVLNGDSAEAEAYGRTLAEAGAYLDALVERKRARPGPDVLSGLVAACDEDGGRLSHDELVSTALLLLLAGHDTTVNLIANAVLALLRAPDQLAPFSARLVL
jgi:cytochrome P450